LTFRKFFIKSCLKLLFNKIKVGIIVKNKIRKISRITEIKNREIIKWVIIKLVGITILKN